MPRDHLDRPKCLNNLAMRLGDQFQRTGSPIVLDEAICIGRETLEYTPQDHPNRLTYLSNLGIRLGDRYLRTGSTEDLDESIRVMREAIECTPQDYPSRHKYLNNLGVRLGDRYHRTGSIENLNKLIRISREIIESTPRSHPSRPIYLNTLVLRLGDQYLRTGSIEDLEDSIRIGREAVEITPINHPDLSKYLNSLGLRLGDRYLRTGSTQDLDEAIHIGKESIKNTAMNLPARGVRLSNLSVRLGDRYLRTRSIEDLEDSIHVGREAVKITPVNHPDLPRHLNNLGLRLGDRYLRTGSTQDLDEAIHIGKESIKNTPMNLPARGVRLSNLSVRLGDRYLRTGSIEDLEDSIRVGREAVEITPLNHPDLPRNISNLSIRLMDRFRRTGKIKFMEEAIQLGAKAVEMTPSDHPIRALYLSNLGHRLQTRAEKEGMSEDLDAAKALFTEALYLQNSPPLPRILAGRSAGLIHLQSGEWQQSCAVLQAALELLPRISPRVLARDDQQHVLSGLSGLSTLAASAAIQTGKSPAKSFEILEAGRGIISGLAINSRNDVSKLRDEHPQLCSKYTELREVFSSSLSMLGTEDGNAVEISATAGESQTHADSHLFMSERIEKRQNDFRLLIEVEDEIRKLPGFERFQLPPSAPKIMSLASNGPIVSFNVTQTRSDAFLITESNIEIITLPKLEYSRLKDIVPAFVGEGKLTNGHPGSKALRNKLMRDILWWLWEVAVLPVLKALKFDSKGTSQKLPRVYWMASGFMGLVPLHAAGRCWGSSDENTISHVVSTYIPTLKALEFARERPLQPLIQPEQRMLIISMPETIGFDGKLLAKEEESAILKSTEQFLIPAPTVLTIPSKSEVIRVIGAYRIVHLVCHGSSDAIDPSKGGLFLGENSQGQADHLSIRDLAKVINPKAQIAYLSACSTAQNSAKSLMDEVIHVASSFQLIGFPHVIATMWEADNRAAVAVAGTFYREFAKNMADSVETARHDAVAYAMHAAVVAVMQGAGSLRMRKYNSYDDVIAWATFIHIGA